MKAHLVGGGLASLAAATYLMKDAGLGGRDITIYEASDQLGGALGMSGSADEGYVYPGGRIFEREYRCALELFDLIPSRSDSGKSIKDEIDFFNDHYSWKNRCRLIDREGRVLDASDLGLTWAHRLQLFRLMLTPETMLDGKEIKQFFSPSFFETNFWYVWSSIMAMLPSHSAIELHRYEWRFLHLLPQLASMEYILRTKFHQQEAIVEPVVAYLKKRGVIGRTGTVVEDLQFADDARELRVTALDVMEAGDRRTIPVEGKDIVIITNGSPIADITVGTMEDPPPMEATHQGRSWALWRKIAAKRSGLGNPSVFADNVDSTLVSFTVTTRSTQFMKRLEDLTKREAGRGGLVTFRDSNWLLTFTRFHDPNLIGQPDNVHMLWGYAIRPWRSGDFMVKTMYECSGREVMTELLSHLHMQDDADRIIDASICRPCRLPYAGAVMNRRTRSDRPPVVPKGSRNLAFMGQFSEQPGDVIFTMEYSVRSARNALHGLLGTPPPPPIYKGYRSPALLWRIGRAI